MSTAVSPAPESRFSDRVENYVRYRPGYPEAVLEILKSAAGLHEGSSVADIGSGTGISSALLLRCGGTVYGVEPNAEMRAAAEHLLGKQPGFVSIAGRAQATTLPDSSVDLIVAAQAFHWFDTPETRAEFTRILRPAGRIALIWNERLLDSSPFQRDYEKLLLQCATDYSQVRHENITNAELSRFFRGEWATHELPNYQSFDLAGLSGRLLSCSYAPPPGHPRHGAMMDGLAALFHRYQNDGFVKIDYRTVIYTGR